MTLRSHDLSFVLAIIVTGAAAALAWFLKDFLPHAGLSMLFLAAVLVVASRTGLVPGLFAAVLGFFSFNWLFTEPRYTLHVESAQDIATLLLFLFVAAVTGSLAAAMRREADENEANIRKLSILGEFSQKMLGALDAGDVCSRLANELRSVGMGAWGIISPAAQGMPGVLHHGDTRPFSLAQVNDLWAHAEDTFVHSAGLSLYPLVTDAGRAALLVIESRDAHPDELVMSLCQQASAALERLRLAENLASARLENETEQLRSALLSSVSHDLRTPLASIIGSTSSLRDLGASISTTDRTQLLDNVLAEARRLDRYIQNLLDMTRLGRGNIPLHRDWVDVRDVVTAALSRVRPSPEEKPPVDVTIAADVPLIWVHGALIEQALVNLIDNALRYAPAGSRVQVKATFRADHVTLDIDDEGIGIPEELRERVFDMFYTAQQGDRGARSGSGLGLAICKGLVAAHQGTIAALPGGRGRGTCMRIRLPVDAREGDTPAAPSGTRIKTS